MGNFQARVTTKKPTCRKNKCRECKTIMTPFNLHSVDLCKECFKQIHSQVK